MVIHIAATGCSRRVVGGGNIAVVTVNVLNGEGDVKAEGQQPATDEHRDRIPGTVSQLMSCYGADHTNHQTGHDHSTDMGAKAGSFFCGQNINACQRLNGRPHAQNVA